MIEGLSMCLRLAISFRRLASSLPRSSNHLPKCSFASVRATLQKAAFPLFVCPECAHHDCGVAATGDVGSTTEPVGLAFQIPVSV